MEVEVDKVGGGELNGGLHDGGNHVFLCINCLRCSVSILEVAWQSIQRTRVGMVASACI